MKYIRTKDGRIGTSWEIASKPNIISFGQPHKFRQEITKDNVLKQADTIEELCDEFVMIQKDNSKGIYENYNGWLQHRGDNYYSFNLRQVKEKKIDISGSTLYGAIWTDKGLIYVAKMNDKGELELL